MTNRETGGGGGGGGGAAVATSGGASKRAWPGLKPGKEYVTQNHVDDLVQRLIKQGGGGGEGVDDHHPCDPRSATQKAGSGDPCEHADVQPALLMTRSVRVHLMPSTKNGGVRAYALISQGFLNHPDIVNVESKDIRTAEWVV